MEKNNKPKKVVAKKKVAAKSTVVESVLPKVNIKEFVISNIKKVKPMYIILGCIAIMICLYFYFSSPNSIKQENNRLKKEIKEIQNQKDKNKDTINILVLNYSKLQDSIKLKEDLLKQIDQRISVIEKNTASSVGNLNKIKDGLNSINNDINNLNKNPEKKIGSELINSLESKIKVN